MVDSALIADPRWETADAEIKIFSADSPKPLQVLSLKPGVDLNTCIAWHASPAAINSAFVLSTFPVPSTSHFLTCLERFSDVCPTGESDIRLLCEDLCLALIIATVSVELALQKDGPNVCI